MGNVPIGVYESGTSITNIGYYSLGTTLKIERTGGSNPEIIYSVNGSPLRNVTDQHPNQPMMVDFSFYNNATKIHDLQIHVDRDYANYTADVTSYSDYYPFGMQMPGRNGSSGEYRFGFQGQEKDDEVKGAGNSINYKYRMHDPRVGRFFAVDPLFREYAFNSPYAFCLNRVIDAIELEGLEAAKPKSGATNLVVVIQGYTGTDPSESKTQAQNDPNNWVDYGGLGDIETAFGNNAKIQVVTFSSSHSSETNEDAIKTIEDFKKANPDSKIIVVGHSLGADNSVELTQSTNTEIDLLVTLDIAAYWDTDNIPSNVKQAVNIFQDNDFPGGEDIEIDDENKTTGQNIEALESNHRSIDNDFRGTVIQMISNILGEKPNIQPKPVDADKVKIKN